MTSRSPRRDGARAASATAASAALPAWKAFVVQFVETPAGATRAFSGRVEHLHSGSRLHFGSRDDLVVALDRMLDEIDGAGGGEAS